VPAAALTIVADAAFTFVVLVAAFTMVKVTDNPVRLTG
jgi:hypothetical protein